MYSNVEEIKRLVNDLKADDFKTVQLAIVKLSRIGPDIPGQIGPAVEELQNLLQDKNPEIRMRSVWAIGQIGYKAPQNIATSIPSVVELLSDQDPTVRANAIWTMGRIGRADPQLVEQYLPDMVTTAGDPDERVRSNFLWACENIAAVKPEWLQPYLDLFLRFLDEEDNLAIRRDAPKIFRVIAKQRPEIVRAIEPRLKLLLEDSDEIVRLHARGTLRALR